MATPAPSTWSLIALAPVQLENYSRALSGKPLSPPPAGRILRPAPRDAARLRLIQKQEVRRQLASQENNTTFTRAETFACNFQESLGVTAKDLEALCKDLIESNPPSRSEP